MDNEMIERAAIAIKEAQWGTRVAWKDCEETFKTIKRQQARAAIKAMREPTEKILEPVTNADDFFKLKFNDPKKAWRTMIDAIIDDK